MNNNYFEIKNGNDIIVKHNAVKSAFAHFLAGKSYAAYLRIANKDRCIYKPTTVMEGNFDVSKGRPYVKLTTSFLQSEFSGTVTELGLCPEPYSALSNVCSVTFLPKGKVTVTVTLYLHTSGPITFCAGENVLIKSLLGICPLPELALKGANFAAYDDYLIDESVYEDVPFDIDKQEALIVKATNCVHSDYLVVADGKGVARFNCVRYFPKAESKNLTCEDGFFIEALRVAGMNSSMAQIPVPLSMGAHLTVTASGRLMTDPEHLYVYLVSGGKVYDINNPIKIKYVCDGEDVRACSDGSVAVKNGNEIAIFGKDVTKIPCYGNSYEVIYRSGGYDVYILQDTTLFCYRVQNGTELIRTIETEGNTLKAFSAYEVVVSGNGAHSYSLYDNGGFAENLSLIENEIVYDGCYYGDGYAGSIYTYLRTGCEKAKNGFCVKDGKLYCIIAGGAQYLGEFDYDDIIMGNEKIYIIKDGKLSVYGFYRKGVYVLCDSGTRTFTAYFAPTEAKNVKLKIAGAPIG